MEGWVNMKFRNVRAVKLKKKKVCNLWVVKERDDERCSGVFLSFCIPFFHLKHLFCIIVLTDGIIVSISLCSKKINLILYYCYFCNDSYNSHCTFASKFNKHDGHYSLTNDFYHLHMA